MTDEKLSASVKSHDVHINIKYTLQLKSFFHFWISPYQHIFLKEYNTIQWKRIEWNRTEYRRAGTECTLIMINLMCSP